MKTRIAFLFVALLMIAQGAWAQTDLETPLTLEAKTAGMIVINFPKSGMQYSVNGGAKTAVSTKYTQFVINVDIGDKVQFYGTGTSLTRYAYSGIDGTAQCYIYGNIMSLVDEFNFATATTLTSNEAFATLFQETAILFNHPTRKLKLPATTLTSSCYEQMFFRCWNLTEAPELPATTLAEGCYRYMFSGCTKLTVAPELPASKLAKGCYESMFSGCSKLNFVICYATDISASLATIDWIKGVAATGTFVKANEMESWSTGKNGIPSGWTVKNAFTYVTTEAELNAAIDGGANIIKLMEDITLAQRVEIGVDKTVTIDLNGHTLRRNQDGYHWYFMVIHNYGTLTINDSSGDNSGMITGGHAYGGAGIYCEPGSKLTFNGGTIIGNSSTNDPSNGAGFGGGILINSGAEATITGGFIVGNGAPLGGGIYNQGTLTLSNNALISGNTGNYGGGIYNTGTLNFIDGTITDNLANLSSGGGIWNSGTLNMKGKPIVSGNTSTANGIDNVYLNGSSVITVTGAFTEGAKIGVRPASTSNAFTSNYSTYNQGTTPNSFFSSDVEFHKVLSNGDGEAVLIEMEGNWTDEGNYSSNYSNVVGKTVYIENEAEFARLSWDVNHGYNAGYTFILNKDLDMSAHYWTPIGTDYDHPFKSHFNGNGHTISGIYVNSTANFGGLFGIVKGSTYVSGAPQDGCDYIKNFVLKDSYIKGGNYTGGVVGFLWNSLTLENVACQADVTGGTDVGGIVGQICSSSVYYPGTSFPTNVRNCLFLSGKVTGTGLRAAVFGNMIDTQYLLSRSNNYYLDPASAVGNDYDVRAYPIATSLPEGVTGSYALAVLYNGIHYHPAGTANLIVKFDFGQTAVVKVNGNEVVESEGSFPFTIDPATTEPYEVTVTLDNYDITGSGTEAEPYRITSQADWNYFVSYLNSGSSSNNYSGVHFQLDADNITVNQRMGNASHPFCGTFDGDGNKLTLAFGDSEDYLNQECAPFYCLKNATIKNLVIDGSIYSSAQHNAGIAVTVKGQNNYIQNCVSSVSIYSNRSGDCTNGGFIGIHDNGSDNVCDIIFEGCAFTGELVGENATNWGGFVGWRDYQNYNLQSKKYSDVHFNNCLFAPTNIRIATPDGSNSRTFCRSRNSTTAGAYYNNSYYTEDLQVTDGGKQAYYLTTAPANIGSETTHYDYDLVTGYTNGLKCGERYYTNCVGFYDNASNAGLVSELGTTYDGKQVNVALTGRTLYRDEDWNTLCLPFDVTLADSPLKGAEARTLSEASFTDGTLTLTFGEPVETLTAGTPYIIKWNKTTFADLVIKTPADWNAFADAVNNGNNYSGKTVLLTNDINVETMVGTSSNKFKGTLDGDGHTLTFNKNTSEQYCAPFRYVEDATIMNLHTTGIITTNKKFAAGLVGYTKGTTVINNCWSSVSINSSVSGDGSHGGIVAYTEENASNTTLTNCLFDGSITGENTNSCGGLIGWNYDKATLTNCVFRPTGITLANSGNATFCRGSNVTVTNCYYSEELPGATGQGEAIGNMSDEELASALGSGWQVNDGKVITVKMKAPVNIVSPVFSNVIINSAEPERITPGFSAGTEGDGSVTFIGTYDPVEIGEEGDNTKLYFSSGNTLYWPNGAITINPFRAYFQLNTATANARSIVLNFGEGETTRIEVRGVEEVREVNDDGWWTLDGRKLDVKPTRRGIYINNGKKYIIK